MRGEDGVVSFLITFRQETALAPRKCQDRLLSPPTPDCNLSHMYLFVSLRKETSEENPKSRNTLYFVARTMGWNKMYYMWKRELARSH